MSDLEGADAKKRLFGLMAAAEAQQVAVQNALAGLATERAALEVEIAGLEASRNELVRAGLLAQISRCNPGNRPCIRVDDAAGPFGIGDTTDYRIIKGY